MSTLKNFSENFDGNQQALADFLGVQRPYLSQLISGKKKPSLELANRIEQKTNGEVPMSSWLLEPAE